MSDNKLDAVIAEIAELTNTIKEHAPKEPTLDWPALEAKMAELLQKHSEAVLETIPVRAGEYPAATHRAVEAYKGKYHAEVRDIVEHGEYKIGNWRLRSMDLFLAQQLIQRANDMKANRISFAGEDKVKPVSEDLAAAVKLMTSTGTGIGDELVPTNMATELWEDFFTASRVAADLPNQPMPSDPFDMPLGLGDVTWRKGGQGQPSTPQNPATAKSTLTSTEQVAEVDWSYNLDEDSVVAMMPSLRRRLQISGGEQMDAFCLNADATATATGNINLDDDTPDADSYYLSGGQDGIRHLYIVDNTDQHVNAGGDALADADITGALNKLDKYGVSLDSVRIVPGISAYFAMLGLTNVATVDKYGPMATIVKGELARYRGVTILPSSSQPKAEADGKVSATAANNTLGTISMYNRNMWTVGFKRGLLIEVDKNIRTRELYMVVSFRIAIGAYGTRSTALHTSGIRNILL